MEDYTARSHPGLSLFDALDMGTRGSYFEKVRTL
jgi:hypothetical protein